jgi:hypothetical protein
MHAKRGPISKNIVYIRYSANGAMQPSYGLIILFHKATIGGGPRITAVLQMQLLTRRVTKRRPLLQPQLRRLLQRSTSHRGKCFVCLINGAVLVLICVI